MQEQDICAECGTPLGKRQRKYCSARCAGIGNSKIRIAKHAIARAARAANDHRVCEQCGGKLTLEQRKFCSRHCAAAAGTKAAREAVLARPAASLKMIERNGYSMVYVRGRKPSPSQQRAGRYVYLHRYIMEQQIGRELESHEVVHHINRNKHDNRIENLELLAGGHAEHRRRHKGEKRGPQPHLWKMKVCDWCGAPMRSSKQTKCCSFSCGQYLRGARERLERWQCLPIKGEAS